MKRVQKGGTKREKETETCPGVNPKKKKKDGRQKETRHLPPSAASTLSGRKMIKKRSRGEPLR